MNASDSELDQLDAIQSKALRIIGADVAEAARNVYLSLSLRHHRQVAATIELYKMHTSYSVADLKTLPPSLYEIRRYTRPSTSMPSHPRFVPISKTL